MAGGGRTGWLWLIGACVAIIAVGGYTLFGEFESLENAKVAALRKHCVDVLSNIHRQLGLTTSLRHEVADCLDQEGLTEMEVRAVDADLVGGAR